MIDMGELIELEKKLEGNLWVYKKVVSIFFGIPMSWISVITIKYFFVTVLYHLIHTWCPLKEHTYLKSQLKAAGFFKHVWPFSWHQALKG